jgi:hypothetical protein
LRRRIHYIVYHYKEAEKFLTFEISMNKYIDYAELKKLAEEGKRIYDE